MGAPGDCSTVTGQFVILELQYDAASNLQRFHATFEQHCNGAAAALTGEIYLLANPWR